MSASHDIVEDVLPTCHGPTCVKRLTERSPSPWFCSIACQEAWQRQWGQAFTQEERKRAAAATVGPAQPVDAPTPEPVERMEPVAEPMLGWLDRWVRRLTSWRQA